MTHKEKARSQFALNQRLAGKSYEEAVRQFDFILWCLRHGRSLTEIAKQSSLTKQAISVKYERYFRALLPGDLPARKRFGLLPKPTKEPKPERKPKPAVAAVISKLKALGYRPSLLTGDPWRNIIVLNGGKRVLVLSASQSIADSRTSASFLHFALRIKRLVRVSAVVFVLDQEPRRYWVIPSDKVLREAHGRQRFSFYIRLKKGNRLLPISPLRTDLYLDKWGDVEA